MFDRMGLMNVEENVISSAEPTAAGGVAASTKSESFELARYVDEAFESEELNHLIRDRIEPPLQYTDGVHKYRSKDVLPDWIMKTKDWKNTKGKTDGSDISEILRVQPANRTLEQAAQLVHFLMAVWATARQMGIKKCTQMLNEFKYVSYEPAEHIITEGEEGMTFYIIISGMTAVHKGGIGIVARLGKGKAFGELALVKGDVRTASIIAETAVEVLSLHKLDYDHFIKDIQAAERRENFYLLRDCSLFASWPRAKIEKMVNTCHRKTIEAGNNVFKQGEDPESLYVIMDGTIHIIKEVMIESKNRWPTSQNTWGNKMKKKVIPILTHTLHKGDHFGELAIIKGTIRLETAKASTKVVLVKLDKLEFLHLVHHDATISNQLQQSTLNNRYPVDDQILKLIGKISGGPTSQAKSGELTIYPNKIVPLKAPPKQSNERPSTILNRKLAEEAREDRLRRSKSEYLGETKSIDFDTDKVINRDNYDQKMTSALKSDALLNVLQQGVVASTMTVEKQAVKEISAAMELLRNATHHKDIIENPLAGIPGAHKKPTSCQLSKLKRIPRRTFAPKISFEVCEMKDLLRNNIHSPDGRRDTLLATVVNKQNEVPGIPVRRLKGDEYNPRVVVEKRLPKPAQAFI